MPASILRCLAIAALLPSVAFAQRGGGVNVRGERAGDVGGRGFVMPRASDLEDHTPVAIVLDKKKKLALSDSQVTALKEIAKQLKEKNAPFYSMWDSTRVVMRSASAGSFGGTAPSAADEERMATARGRLMAISRALREGDDWARTETLKLLTDEQKPKAEEFWKGDAEDFGQKLRGPGGGRGGPPGDRPPGA